MEGSVLLYIAMVSCVPVFNLARCSAGVAAFWSWAYGAPVSNRQLRAKASCKASPRVFMDIPSVFDYDGQPDSIASRTSFNGIRVFLCAPLGDDPPDKENDNGAHDCADEPGTL